MNRLMVTLVAAVAVVGCGVDPCTRDEDCAKKAGEAFSITECRTSLQKDREQASTKGCGSQYEDLLSCYTGLVCGTTQAQFEANCGSRINAYNKCIE